MPKLFHGYFHPTTTNPATITTKVIVIKPTPEIAFTKRIIPRCIPVKMRITMSQPWNHQANQNDQEQPESCDRPTGTVLNCLNVGDMFGNKSLVAIKIGHYTCG